MINEGYTVTAEHAVSGKQRSMPVRSLHRNNPNFYKNPRSPYRFLVAEPCARELLERVQPKGKPGASSAAEGCVCSDEPDTTSAPAATEKRPGTLAAAPNFDETWQRIQAMTLPERVDLLDTHTTTIQHLARNPDRQQQETHQALINVGADGALSNRSTILEALKMSNEEARRYTDQMVEATNRMIDTTALLVDGNLCHQDLLDQVADKSNGTVIQHMTRVFLLGYAFMLYYNREILTSDLVGKIRIRFTSRYKPFYTPLLSHLHEDHLTLERVFQGGMRALQESEINQYAIGFLVHDIGKVEDIEYHEGEDGYDRAKVVRHVEVGYTALRNKTGYSDTVSMITGYHHEYYGSNDGYGIFRRLLQQLYQQHPQVKPRKFPFLITYDKEEIRKLQAPAYFPAKMLEIVDIYDSLTDPNRRYRAPMEPKDALETLYTAFVADQPKVDLILLDVFTLFLRDKGLLPADDIPAEAVNW
ncbi:metal-dependent phosphohydrolase [Spirochaeta africana]|nr:metal-dependent phosphohydrolase [Spirochaeta africana]